MQYGVKHFFCMYLPHVVFVGVLLYTNRVFLTKRKKKEGKVFANSKNKYTFATEISKTPYKNLIE